MGTSQASQQRLGSLGNPCFFIIYQANPCRMKKFCASIVLRCALRGCQHTQRQPEGSTAPHPGYSGAGQVTHWPTPASENATEKIRPVFPSSISRAPEARSPSNCEAVSEKKNFKYLQSFGTEPSRLALRRILTQFPRKSKIAALYRLWRLFIQRPAQARKGRRSCNLGARSVE